MSLHGLFLPYRSHNKALQRSGPKSVRPRLVSFFCRQRIQIGVSTFLDAAMFWGWRKKKEGGEDGEGASASYPCCGLIKFIFIKVLCALPNRAIFSRAS